MALSETDSSTFKSLEDIAECLKGDRIKANHSLGALLKNSPSSEIETAILKSMKAELHHIGFVRAAFERITGKPSSHDWSKDCVYMVTCCVGLGMKRADLLGNFLSEEIENHYKLEGHHPEHMEYSHKMMTSEDILEMAIDRMSRNLQFNNGCYKMLQLTELFLPKMRFCPVCSTKKGQNDSCEHEQAMVREYLKYVEMHADVVAEEWEAAKMSDD